MSALGNLFSDIAGAIREKTGETGTMKPAQFPEKIREIEGGGSADVRYVTFMSHDGTVEYGKKAVAVGDDCANPIARGVFATPTRESDVQYNYTFAGWATTVNGGMDDNALKAVTEDRIVYANFIAALRSYTIKYYDSDGTTLLYSETLTYGSVPAFKPEKDGFTFKNWTPAVATVTENATYTAVWDEKLTFAGGSWADIVSVIESGQAKEYFKVGDKKTTTTNGVAVTYTIIGFDHDDLSNGTGKANVTILVDPALSADTTDVSNWVNLSSWMKKTLKLLLPSAVQSAVKSVKKQCDGTTTGGNGSVTEVDFELFPLSFNECKIEAYGITVFGDETWSGAITMLGETYEYYADNYVASWKGPQSTWYGSTTKKHWMRQWYRGSTCKGLYTYRSLNTSSKKYADRGNMTDLMYPMVAFCI